MAPAALVICSFGGTLAAAIGAGWLGIAAAALVYIVIGYAYLTFGRNQHTEEGTDLTKSSIEPARNVTRQPVAPTQIPETAEKQQVIFAVEELTDLGVSQEDIRFKADMTIQEFHEAEVHFRSALPLREVSWWSSADTRLRAEFTMETQFSRGSLDACEDWLTWLRLPRQAGTETCATLEWLLHTQQGQLEAWKEASPLHQAVLHRLSQWLDAPSQDISTALLDRALIYHAIRNSIQSLEEREQQVLTMRYGLGTADPITLEEAGQSLHVTRERIRQIEARALNRLRHPSRRLSIELATEVARWLLNESPPKAPVYGQPSEAARLLERQLTPMGQILLGSYSPEEQTTIAHSIGLVHQGRFVLGCGASAQTAELAEAIDAAVSETDPRFPLLLPAFQRVCVATQGTSTGSMADAIGASHSVALHAGYVVPQRPPRAVLDAVELHQRMLAAGGHVDRTFFGRRDPKLAAQYPPGDLARRDFDAAVGHPHLFMKLGDLTWLALDDQIEARSIPSPTRGTGQHPQDFDAESRVSEIRKVVAKLGFARLVSIRTQLAHIPEGSVHAIVNSRGDFERVAPGTYCITDEEVDGHEDQLLDTWHVEHYLLGRKCGEHLGSYRAWTPAIEYAWCKWARAQDPEHYPELLHFAQIDAWPLDPEDRAFWQEQVAHNAGPPVAPAIYPTSDPRLPDPTELLEIILMIHADAGINQLRVNRSLGSRPRISTKWTYLAVLVAAGWLEESDSFFGWHARASSDEARAQIEADMLSERLAEGANSASSPAFVEALELALAGLQAGHCAWLRDDSRNALIRVIQSSIQSSSEETTEPEPPALSLDSLLSDMQAKRAFDRLSGDL